MYRTRVMKHENVFVEKCFMEKISRHSKNNYSLTNYEVNMRSTYTWARLFVSQGSS